MMPSPRRSTLQTQILAALAVEPAVTVSALAESLERSRPSVSRSLHRLAEEGYVEKQGRSWHLTDSGQHEAETATKALQAEARDFVEIAGKKFKAVSSIHDQISGLHHHATVGESLTGLNLDLANTTLGQMTSLIDQFSLANSLGLGSAHTTIAAMAGLGENADNPLLASSLAATISPMGEMAEIARGMIEPTLSVRSVVASLYPDLEDFNPLAEAMQLWQVEGVAALASPLLSAQDAFAFWLDTVPALDSSLGYSAIANQTRLLSSTLADVMVLPDYAELIAGLALEHSIDPDLLALPGNLSLISSSLADVFEENLSLLRAPQMAVPSSMVASHLYQSTLPVSHFAEANRYLLADPIEIDENCEEPVAQEPPYLGNIELDPLLHQLNPDYVDKRHGAWLALNDDNPDRLAHAAGSQRNLLLQLLRQLVPDEPIAEDDRPGSKIKARVKQLMGGSKSDTEHVVTIADAVFAGYRVLCKYDHTNQKDQRALRAHMQAAEAFMYLLLVKLDEESG